jgi:TldD protein
MKKRNSIRFMLLTAMILGVTVDALGQNQFIIKAMKDEMGRAMSGLKIDTMKPPYYLAYTVYDQGGCSVRATMGGLVSSSEPARSRPINVQLRVGGMNFDNTNFASFAAFGRSRLAYVAEDGTMYSAFDGDYDALRRDLWLTTDMLYKRALDNLSKKKGALQNSVRTDTTADFSMAKPYSATMAPLAEKFDKQQWQETVKRLSAVFKKFPGIQRSEVTAGASDAFMYFLNNEGSQVSRGYVRSFVEVTASTQASDGMPLIDYLAFNTNSQREIPNEKELIQGIEAMANDLTARRDAVLLDSYSGPILFEKQAAAEVISQGLGPSLCNIREPVSDNAQLAQMIKNQMGESTMQNKIGAKVLADFVSVTDDPTKTSYNGTLLIGGYPVDAEGVPALEVKLVEKGILKTLLTSRMPHKRIPESNGHARGLAHQAFFSNLFVTSTKTMKDAELKNALLAMCKERGLDFGIIIRKMANPYFQRLTRDQSDPMSAYYSATAPKPLVGVPLAVFKIYLDGHEERVRGMEIAGMTLQSFKEITATSEEVYVYNHVTSQRRPSYSGVFDPQDTRVSVVTPSLLFESIDLKKTSAPHRTAPIAPHPVFGQ